MLSTIFAVGGLKMWKAIPNHGGTEGTENSHGGEVISKQKPKNMSTKDFSTELLVSRTPEEVFNAINNIRGWWAEDVEGDTEPRRHGGHGEQPRRRGDFETKTKK